MFERDKDELRELGIPLVTEDIDPLHEDEPGYRIHQREYALPDISFEADELAVLGLASRTWAQASLAGPAAQALRKLRAAGVERDVDALIGIEPRLRTTEPAFDAVKDGVLRRVPLAFSYRRPEAAEAGERHVQPWSLVSWHGRWYLNAFDVDRGAPRAFRLSRIVGPVRTTGRAGSFEVPDDHEPELMVQRVAQPPEPAEPGRAAGAPRHRAQPASARPHRRRGRPDLGPRRPRPHRPRGLRRGARGLRRRRRRRGAARARRLGGAAAARRRSPPTGVRADGRLHAGDRDGPAGPAAHDGAVAGQPPGHRPAAGGRRPRRQRRAARGRPQPALPVRVRPAARRADRGRLGGGPGVRRQRRHHRPPAAPRASTRR